VAKRKPKDEVTYKGTIELLNAFHPENPRDHSIEPGGDVEKTAISLLHAGWCELPSYNARNDKLIGGHGRVLACEYLMQQNKEWFAEQWQQYQEINPKADAEAQARFAAGYWLKVPLKLSEMRDPLHKAMMVRLNNETARGKSDERLKAAILSKLPPKAQEVAMPDPERRSKFLTRFAEVQAEAAASPEVQAEADRQQAVSDRVDAIRSQIAEVAEDAATEAEDAAPSAAADEPDVSEGGANFNADPEASQRKQVMYPLAIILSDRRYRQFQEWKRQNKLTTDQAAFLKGHEVFAVMEGS